MKSICKLCCIATLACDPSSARVLPIAARAERRHAASPRLPTPNLTHRPPAEARPISRSRADKPKSPATDQLSVEQARLADRFKRLEEVIGRLAELSAPTDPRRAKLFREAIAQSREQDVNTRFESIVKLLQDERLSAASTNQTELQKELDALLGLLLKADRDKELSIATRADQELHQTGRPHHPHAKRRPRPHRRRRRAERPGRRSTAHRHRHRQTRRRHLQDRRRQNTESDKPPRPDDKDQPKTDEKEKPKSDDKQKPKTDDKDKPKSDDKQKPDNDAPKPGEPSKPDDSHKARRQIQIRQAVR